MALLALVLALGPVRAEGPAIAGCDFCSHTGRTPSQSTYYRVEDSGNLDGVYCETCFRGANCCGACGKQTFSGRRTERGSTADGGAVTVRRGKLRPVCGACETRTGGGGEAASASSDDRGEAQDRSWLIGLLVCGPFGLVILGVCVIVIRRGRRIGRDDIDRIVVTKDGVHHVGGWQYRSPRLSIDSHFVLSERRGEPEPDDDVVGVVVEGGFSPISHSKDAGSAFVKGDRLLEDPTPETCSQALACFEYALGIDPGCAMALLEKGHALAVLGRKAEGLAAMDRAVEAAAKHPGLRAHIERLREAYAKKTGLGATAPAPAPRAVFTLQVVGNGFEPCDADLREVAERICVAHPELEFRDGATIIARRRHEGWTTSPPLADEDVRRQAGAMFGDCEVRAIEMALSAGTPLERRVQAVLYLVTQPSASPE